MEPALATLGEAGQGIDQAHPLAALLQPHFKSPTSAVIDEMKQVEAQAAAPRQSITGIAASRCRPSG